MAAAAIRYAVRRLGGRALQGPQPSYTAAAGDIKGSRAVWPTSSRRTTSSASEDANAKPAAELLAKNNKEYLASTLQKKIQNKQEELFRLIAKMDREFPSHCTKDNRQLLMHLSVVVKPKPHDPQWRFFRRALTCNHCGLYGSALFLAYLALSDDISELYGVVSDDISKL